MKKTGKYLLLTALVALPMAFTSCDDDDWYDPAPWWYDYYSDDHYGPDEDNFNGGSEDEQSTWIAEAQALNGRWTGTMQYVTATDTGDVISQFNADMTFAQYSSNLLQGSGVEIDTDDEGATQTLQFSWYVEAGTGNIYIKYASGTIFVMDATASSGTSGFYLDADNGTFEGYLNGQNTGDQAYINLIRNNSSYAKSFVPTRSAASAGMTFGSSRVTAPRWNATPRLAKGR